jgi:exonuclease SbcD
MDVFEGFDYVALGHIHKAQAIAPHIRYSGSPIPYSFGSEEEQEQEKEKEKEKGKGVVLIDTDTMEQTFVPLTLRRKRKSLVGTFDEIMGQREYAEHYVSIKITDRYRSSAMMEELERTFKHIIECYGKSYAERTEDHGLSLKELEAMTDGDILRSFFRTYYGSYELTEEEIQIFCDALQENGEEEPA